MPDPSSSAAHHAVGGILVTGLLDGGMHESVSVLRGIEQDAAADLLSAASLPAKLAITVNAFLIKSGASLTLVDFGCGDGMGPDAGRALDSLRQTGVAPEDIDLVLLTHMHPDHIGGLLRPDGTAQFARARVMVPAADAAVFLSESIAATVPDPVKPVFAKARAVAAAYAGRFETFEGGREVAPGITAVPLPGHSPGHTGYRIADGGQSLLIWGDVVHVPALQFGHPEIGMVFDADPGLAELTRREAFAAAAGSGEMVAGMHLPAPGFGRVAATASGFALHPLHAGTTHPGTPG